MFDKVTSQKLRELAENLATIGEEEPETIFDQYPHFAKGLAVLMRTELAERSRKDDSPE